MGKNLPAVLGGIAQVGNLGDRSTLVEDRRRALVISGRRGSNRNGSEAGKNSEELHRDGVQFRDGWLNGMWQLCLDTAAIFALYTTATTLKQGHNR